MTVIAWDGYTLAADKQQTSSEMRRTTTKIHRIGELVVGCAGPADRCAALFDWVRTGRQPHLFPEGQKADDWAHLVVIEDGKVLTYQQTPHPSRLEDPIFAEGSGRDYALAAMYLGVDARKAVAVACTFDPGSGMGIDAIDVIERPEPA